MLSRDLKCGTISYVTNAFTCKLSPLNLNHHHPSYLRMPRVPSLSPATGQPTSSSFIHTTNCNFVDNAGRTLLLRGVNLSGSSKTPLGRPSYILNGFWETAESGADDFIGRPLTIEDGSADVHLARLRGWGFNLIRFPFPWEAIEHEGPCVS